MDMTLQKWAIFIMGVYGENLYLLSDQAEILLMLYKKNIDTHHERFSSEKQVIKKLSPKTAFDKLI